MNVSSRSLKTLVGGFYSVAYQTEECLGGDIRDGTVLIHLHGDRFATAAVETPRFLFASNRNSAHIRAIAVGDVSTRYSQTPPVRFVVQEAVHHVVKQSNAAQHIH